MVKYEKVTVTEEQKELSYYKYYLQEMQEIPEEKKEFLKSPVGILNGGLPLDERNKLFDPGYLPDERGVFPMEDGSLVVSNITKFQGSTGKMLHWWFGWHAIDPLRYAIWDPYDHHNIQISEKDRARILSPNTSIPDKCRDVLHVVTESLTVGGKPGKLLLYFKDPEDLGYEKEKIFTKDCSFMVCANTYTLTEDKKKIPVVMTHMARDIEGGCELRTRFWMGCHIVDKKAKCFIPEGQSFPIEVGKELLAHNFLEFTNLEKILPLVYAEERDNWDILDCKKEESEVA